MKLDLFNFIDETLDLIKTREESIEEVADILEKFFNDSFFINDHFLNVSYRIKSPESLREKILRHNFYLQYQTPDLLLDNLSDLIGFRIECRFIEDEQKIYDDIVELFNIKEADGFYSSMLNSSIMLKLDDPQPQVQKNGFEIYKIDGKYEREDIKINFELQIKSLVNVFWGEIDHRVLYKNFNYMLTEDFLRDIMSSIKDNLAMIDRQLMLVHDHLSGMDTSDEINKKEQLKALLSKIIHDIYIGKVRQEIGFVIDFKKSTDVIVDYIFMKGGPEESERYSENFLRILNKLNEISKEDLSFNQYLSFERDVFYNDEFTRDIGNSIIHILNKDFRWNLFFRIILDIEESSICDEFEEFLIYFRYRFIEDIVENFSENLTSDEREIITQEALNLVAEAFNRKMSVEFLCNFNIEKMNGRIRNSIRSISSLDDWQVEKEKLSKALA